MPSPASPSPSVRRLARGCSAALLSAAAAAALGIGAAAPALALPQELVLIEHAASDATTDTGAEGDSAGDILTFANEVFDAQDANRVGNDQGMCVRTVAGSAWECFWTLTLAAGQITVQGPFYDSGDSVLAITGGTGEYANAQGDMLLSPVGTDGSQYRFTYRLL